MITALVLSIARGLSRTGKSGAVIPVVTCICSRHRRQHTGHQNVSALLTWPSSRPRWLRPILIAAAPARHSLLRAGATLRLDDWRADKPLRYPPLLTHARDGRVCGQSCLKDR